MLEELDLLLDLLLLEEDRALWLLREPEELLLTELPLLLLPEEELLLYELPLLWLFEEEGLLL